MKRGIRFLILLALLAAFLFYEYGMKDTIYVGIIAIGVLILLIIYFILSRRRKFYNCSFEEIDELTGIEFEQYLKGQFRRLHYKVNMTPESGDFGADLVLERNKEVYVVQAKRYSGPVGIKAVQEIIGAIDYYEADGGMVVTNSYYTKAAKELAEVNDILLWDRRDIKEQFQIKD